MAVLRASVTTWLSVVTVTAMVAPSLAAQKVDPSTRVELTTFTLLSPPEKGWEMALDQAHDRVAFRKIHKWLTDVQRVTMIVVLTNDIHPDSTLPSPDSAATGLMNREEQIMQEQGVAKGDYELHDVVRADTVMGDAHFYLLRYTKIMNVMRQGRWAEAATLYVLMPPDYAETRRFFEFLISELYLRGGFKASVDFGQIVPVILSFQERNPASQ